MLPIMNLVWGSLFVFSVLNAAKSAKLQENQNSRLCHSLSKKATRQQLKLCAPGENHNEVVRSNRSSEATESISSDERELSGTPKRTKRQAPDDKVCANPPLDSKNGYDTDGSGIPLTVNFEKRNGTWIANVSWCIPYEGDCVGYEILWDRKVSGCGITCNKAPWYCDRIMNKTTTSYILDSSKDWTQYPILEVAVFPLPKKSRDRKIGVTFRKYTHGGVEPTKEPCKLPRSTLSTIEPTKMPTETISIAPTLTARGTTEKIYNVTETKARPRTNVTAEKTYNVTGNSTPAGAEGRRQEPSKSSSFRVHVYVPIIGAIFIIVVILGVHWTFRRRKANHYNLTVSNKKTAFIEDTPVSTDEGNDANYISYYSENDNITHEAVKIANWLRQHDINVVIDKFSVISHGKRLWCEDQLSVAKKVVLVMTPAYLKICKFDEGVNKQKKLESLKDQWAYLEVCHIRDEMMKKPLNTDRFVVILVETPAEDLPFWMKRLDAYKYENGAVDESILEVLKM